ncbi:WcaG Nucleoside-diphosphate-sugar epimerases [uncultured Caudovirales phage]|uniref:WcaG Nucleoside-diphosphate-sugar epimerases n=1 Tax=uncultured Caudovirales phage TaxID=2100421 RepID=A0A6J7WLH1_9CAUD|nr:WcaG Nucleoside-diphosphate-sugar epimerases [uncultured Caudovirales phage]
MKFIVTGGAGFIGHNVVRQLEAQGHDCYILDNVTDYGFIPEEELAYLYTERTERIRANVHHIDLCGHERVNQFFSNFAFKADAVIHLASLPRQKVVSADPVWGAEVMGTGLVNLLEVTKKYNIPKFVYVSSSMVYGTFFNGVTEDSPCNPIGQYGIMKYMGEKLVEDYTRRGCFDHVIIRPSAVYGEYDVEDRVVSKFMLSAIRGHVLKVNGAGEVLDFTHVEDTAQGIVLAATKPEANNQIFNITRSDLRTYNLTEAAELIISMAGSGTIEIRGKDIDFPSRGRLSIERAVEVLGYRPTVGVEEGFNRYYKWFTKSLYWHDKI